HYIFQRLDKYFDLYSEFNDVAKTKCATLFNFCNYLRLNNRFDEVSNYIYDVLELAKKCHHTLIILEAKYCICEVEWLKNNDSSINNKVSSLISAIRLAEFNLVADDLLQDWKNLTGVTLNC
ncbi:hypothetical protein, partial [Listeria costaricensis]|uniref:hypothetical protein n=1 Tax=Listeria costaricensis TaxID=2026604 RepID=UPI0013C4B10E